jgi:hypothetical protein
MVNCVSVTGTTEELQSKLEAVRAKRAAEKAASDEAIAIKMMENELLLDELVTEHGELGRKIAAVFAPHTGDMVVVRKPSKAAFRSYQSNAASGKQSLEQVMVQLIAGCLIHPSKEEFNKLQDETPALLSKANNAAVKLAGVEQSDVEGK